VRGVETGAAGGGVMPAPLRVTVLSSVPPQKGITPYTLHLLDALAARGDLDLDLLGFRSLYPAFAYPGGRQDAVGDQRDPPVPARQVMSWWNPWSWVRAGLGVRGDVVHAQWWSWFLAPAYIVALWVARRRGKHVVVTAHNIEPHEAAWWKRALNRRVMRSADALIVHAAHNADRLAAQGIDAARISLIPHGPLSLSTAAPSREAARQALGLASNARVALLAGHLRAYKGAAVLLAAAQRLRREIPQLRILIVGELWAGCPDPREEARALGVEDVLTARIGYASDEELAACLAAADVVVLPYTHFDAQSGAGTLALTAGRALVVSDVGGLPQLVRDQRAIVPPGDPGALSRALAAVLSDDAVRARLEADALAVLREISWERIAEETAAVYRGVTAAAAARPLREAA
jgi:glycosyltransferase involved in cell wall biosynthesis